MCYWRRLSKRSASHSNESTWEQLHGPASGDSFSDQDNDGDGLGQFDLGAYGNDATTIGSGKSIRFNLTTSTSTSTTTTEPSTIGRKSGRRVARKMRAGEQDDASNNVNGGGKQRHENLSDRVSLFQALEVRQEREPDNLPVPYSYDEAAIKSSSQLSNGERDLAPMFMCYRRAELFAFMFTVASILLAAISVTIGCCLRASALKRQAAHNKHHQLLVPSALSLSSANNKNSASLAYSTLSSYYNSASPASPSSSSSTGSAASSPAMSPQSLWPHASGHQPVVCGGQSQARQPIYLQALVSNNRDLVRPLQTTAATTGPSDHLCHHEARPLTSTGALLNQHHWRGNSRIKQVSAAMFER